MFKGFPSRSKPFLRKKDCLFLRLHRGHLDANWHQFRFAKIREISVKGFPACAFASLREAIQAWISRESNRNQAASNRIL
jgi:hypothetical protein